MEQQGRIAKRAVGQFRYKRNLGHRKLTKELPNGRFVKDIASLASSGGGRWGASGNGSAKAFSKRPTWNAVLGEGSLTRPLWPPIIVTEGRIIIEFNVTNEIIRVDVGGVTNQGEIRSESHSNMEGSFARSHECRISTPSFVRGD